ncbi:hemolysin family protein [Liquorilactobacillus satsumensis]|nr:hemolysin family protein [Liquorilactobacillus satsumensis]MCC7666168.1 HlyC/CorC family transporter [Liquorilactobacillus satsumensis]MCP9329151.1 HlyC/CorC family transporter [Liquorilactobacillus satsumensis]MCP9357435.1 HlyC/CorC family transporter [Liquorilactobacillus satsumensis]MCP9371263.1 HlyC/CorC family transporter [Liquorilactobacillus satsumensis]
MTSGQLAINLLIMVVVFYFAAFFVATEFALVQTRKSALESALEAGKGNRRKLQTALKMVQNLNEYLSTTQVGVTLAGIILGWIGEGTIEILIVDALRIAPISETGLHAIGAILGVMLLTYLEVVLTEIVPKNLSIDMPMKMMMLVVTPLHYFHILFYPFVWLLNVSAAAIIHLFGLRPASESNDVLTQAEILRLSRNAVTGGMLDKNDLLYMQRAFDFNDKIAKDIMVDRTSLEVVDITDSVKTVINYYLRQGFSRFPVVANNDKDKILGYVYIYDLIRQAQVDDRILVSKLLRTIITVPEVTPIQGLLQQMIQKQTPIVVVLDEYGGTSGIVTDKDIYEELFGVVKDEIDNVSSEYILKNADGSYKISGKTTLYDFERFFRTKNKNFDESESVTIAGYLLENYKVKRDDVITIGQFDLKVVDLNHNYIDWLEVRRHAASPDEQNAPQDKPAEINGQK